MPTINGTIVRHDDHAYRLSAQLKGSARTLAPNGKHVAADPVYTGKPGTQWLVDGFKAEERDGEDNVDAQ